MDEIKSILKSFKPISLSELENSALMNRTDTKFAFHISILQNVLKELQEQYFALDIKGNRISRYETLYFDDEDYSFYLDHHNGKGNRHKVRKRKYIESELSFVEVKNKVKGRTIKSRRAIQDIRERLSPEEKDFASQLTLNSSKLVANLWNHFYRITLVNKNIAERVTFDIGLRFSWGKKEKSFDNIVIAELKQEKDHRDSGFYLAMKKNEIRPLSISKYCLGTVFLHAENGIKTNAFKEKVLRLEKIMDN